MGVSKTSDHIQIKIKMLNPTQKLPVSSTAPNEDSKDMDVLCIFKIKIESQNLFPYLTKQSSSIQTKWDFCWVNFILEFSNILLEILFKESFKLSLVCSELSLSNLFLIKTNVYSELIWANLSWAVLVFTCIWDMSERGSKYSRNMYGTYLE